SVPSGARQHQSTVTTEQAERGFHSVGPARAFERSMEWHLDDVHRSFGCGGKFIRSEDGGAERGCSLAASRCRLAQHDVVHPLGPKHADSELTDRASTGDERALARADPRALDTAVRDSEWLRQR